MSREDAKAAITTAYAEVISEIIGEDEVEYSNLDGNAGYWEKHGRNGLRAEQRQRLQGLLPANGSDGANIN